LKHLWTKRINFSKHFPHLLTLALLTTLLLACSAEPRTPTLAASPTPEVVDETEKVEADLVQLSESDPCAYLSEEQIAEAAGAPVVEVIPADSDTLRSCTYIILPGEQFVTISVYEGEAAKRFLIHERTQMLDGCSLSYLFSSDPGEPTPFPPELEADMDSSLLELFVMDLETQEGCGAAYKAMPGIGANAYTFSTFVQGAVIGVAGEDIYFTLLYADANMDFNSALDLAEQLVGMAVVE